ncbi:MAG: AbrB/MazE/SpoVT family DNA-binding domain-containing protein [Promethearchaeota archaeon]
MTFKRKVGPKGQVVIPKDLRDQLGLRPGSVVGMELGDGAIVIKPPPEPLEYLKRFTGTPRKLEKRIDIERLIEEQYARRLT